MVVWALLLPFLIGFVAIILLDSKGNLQPLETYSLAFFLGTSIFTMLLFLMSLAGIRWRVNLIAIGGVVVSLLGFVVLCYRYHRKLLILPKHQLARYSRCDKLLILGIAIQLATIFYLALNKPIVNWDAWANWGLRAKVFYYEQGISLDKQNPYFLGRGGHINYPLQIPILEAWVFLVVGSWNDQIVKIIFPTFFLFFSVFLFSQLGKDLGRTKALFFAFLFITLPFVVYHAAAAYTDLVVGLYIGVATILLWRYLQERTLSFLILSSLFFAAGGWVKNEGIFLASIVLLFFVMARLKKYFLFVLPGFIFILPWLLFKQQYGLGWSNLSANETIGALKFHPEVIKVVTKEFLKGANFGLLWPTFIFVAIAFRREIIRLKLQLFSLLIFIYLLAYFLIYLFTRNYEFILNGIVFNRNLLTIAPTAFWITAEILGNVVDLRGD